RSDGLEIVFRLDPNVLDGRYANNGWLQELPKPFSKITWDNAALISPQFAQRENLKSGDYIELVFRRILNSHAENLKSGDYIELVFRGRKLAAPVWIQPGQAENS